MHEEGHLDLVQTQILIKRGGNTKVADILKGYGAPADSIDVFSHVRVGPNKQFMNREALRGQLRKLVQGTAKVLVIAGQKQTGRSYSIHLLNHVVASQSSWLTVRICLKKQFRGVPSMKTLACRIVTLAGAQTDGYPEKLAEDSKIVDEVVVWCLGRLVATNRNIVIAIDSFNERLLSVPAMDFVAELAQQIGYAATNVRIVLMGMDYVRPFSDIALLDAVTSLSLADVPGYIRAYVRQLDIEIEQEAVESLILKIRDEVDARGPLSVADFSSLVEQIVEPVFGEGNP
jgi:hypothetical protein